MLVTVLTSARCRVCIFTNINRTEVPDSTCVAACAFALARQLPDAQLWCCDGPYGHIFNTPYLPDIFSVMFGQAQQQGVFSLRDAFSESPPSPEEYLKHRSLAHLCIDVYTVLGLHWFLFLIKASVAMLMSFGTYSVTNNLDSPPYTLGIASWLLGPYVIGLVLFDLRECGVYGSVDQLLNQAAPPGILLERPSLLPEWPIVAFVIMAAVVALWPLEKNICFLLAEAALSVHILARICVRWLACWTTISGYLREVTACVRRETLCKQSAAVHTSPVRCGQSQQGIDWQEHSFFAEQVITRVSEIWSPVFSLHVFMSGLTVALLARTLYMPEVPIEMLALLSALWLHF